MIKNPKANAISERVHQILGTMMRTSEIDLANSVESAVHVKTGYPDLDALIARYPRVFDGKCKVMKGKPHHIELEENAKPISSGATRNVAEPYRESLKKDWLSIERDK